MPPATNNIDAAVDQAAQTVSGTTSLSDVVEWSPGHFIVDWPTMLLNDAIIIAGVGLVVWLIVRKRK
jgi:hypothetical protein